jgi:hypothetical protein
MPEGASRRQLAYLRSLGVEPAVGLSKEAASAAIDAALAARSQGPPDAEQRGMLRFFERRLPRGATYADAERMIAGLLEDDDNAERWAAHEEREAWLSDLVSEVREDAREYGYRWPGAGAVRAAVLEMERSGVGLSAPEMTSLAVLGRLAARDPTLRQAGAVRSRAPSRSPAQRFPRVHLAGRVLWWGFVGLVGWLLLRGCVG